MADTNSFSKHIQFLRGEIEKALQKLPLDHSPDYLYDSIKYVLKGKGKRLRPVLAHLSGNAFEADPEDLMKVGVAVELLHNFTLVHDDIMDEDELRHGQPAVHKQWDNATAILTGDGLFVLSQLMLSGLSPFVQQRFNEVTLAVCEGQGMDKEFENDFSVSMGHYLIMIGKKTGALLGLCAELGALVGNASKENAHHLFEFGLNLGLAFQVQDDYLEIFGDETSMGKSLGSDIRAGKQTALTILAREKDEKKWVDFTKDNPSISAFQSFFESSGIKDECETVIQHYIEKAQDGLGVIPKEKRNHLNHFTTLILNRTY
ncbi:MAG: polyprenyl synthetase family protein [Candidatus Marinimicrobia bacterium]|jgi:geranylgeranyl pyrophosphate synthase|nr:polyprenyl synthetase family protein [Candidatus Neomarinimicrobiota bacterium]MDP6611735.1 polyprenyl synthetase family protein [Candidatus Neomarinimicrobiota bacterium]|tara:strand:- start:60922 stop:61872 length:951 start_codon:yes stop_codon:yes gene_type:complete